jgi:hypothetical protein
VDQTGEEPDRLDGGAELHPRPVQAAVELVDDVWPELLEQVEEQQHG